MLYFDDRNYFISEHVYVFSEHVGGTFYRNFTIDREKFDRKYRRKASPGSESPFHTP